MRFEFWCQSLLPICKQSLNMGDEMKALLLKQLNFPPAWIAVSLAVIVSLFYLYPPKNSHGKKENGNVKLEAIPGPKREPRPPFAPSMIW